MMSSVAPDEDTARLVIGKVQTTDGERLAVTMTMLLTAGQAEAFAGRLASHAAAMLASEKRPK